jgi:hypothetical protein
LRGSSTAKVVLLVQRLLSDYQQSAAATAGQQCTQVDQAAQQCESIAGMSSRQSSSCATSAGGVGASTGGAAAATYCADGGGAIAGVGGASAGGGLGGGGGGGSACTGQAPLHLPKSATVAATVDWAWPARQSNPNQFLKHTLATHLLTLQSEGSSVAKKQAGSAGEVVGPRDTACSTSWTESLIVVELAIKKWTTHHVHIAHQVSSSEEEKAPPGHYKEHTSRSILDIRGH